MDNIIVYILDGTLLIEVLTVIIAATRINVGEAKPRKMLFNYITLYLLIEIIAFTMNKWGVESNQWLYNIFGTIEVWLLFAVLQHYASHVHKKYIKGLMVLSYVAIGTNALFFSEPFLMEYFNYGFAIYSMILSIGGLIVLYNLLQSDDVLDIHRQFSFWFILGIMIYNLCNLPIALVSNIYSDLFTSDNPIILIKPISFILMYICFIIGYLWSKEQSYSSTLS